MAGGMLALGAVTAPIVFGQFSRESAAPVMALIFRRYDLVLQISLGLVLFGEWLRFAAKTFPQSGWLPRVRQLLLGLLTVSLLYATLVLNPEIQRMNQAGVHRDFTTVAGQHFETAHKRSEGIYKANLLMVLALILLTPFVGVRQKAETP